MMPMYLRRLWKDIILIYGKRIINGGPTKVGLYVLESDYI